MTRANRQLKILDIISKHDIDTQEELVAKLRSEGFNITQATISRDIKDMGIIKTLASDGRHYKYAVQRTKDANASDKYLNMFKNTVLSIRSSHNLVVLKTEVGSAIGLAWLDLLTKEFLNGTYHSAKYLLLANELSLVTTIFVGIDSIENTDGVRERLEALLDTAR